MCSWMWTSQNVAKWIIKGELLKHYMTATFFIRFAWMRLFDDVIVGSHITNNNDHRILSIWLVFATLHLHWGDSNYALTYIWHWVFYLSSKLLCEHIDYFFTMGLMVRLLLQNLIWDWILEGYNDGVSGDGEINYFSVWHNDWN